jgi:hypothetical protein
MTIHWKGALSDGTIDFSIQPFSGENVGIFLKKSVLKELRKTFFFLNLSNSIEKDVQVDHKSPNVILFLLYCT